MASENIELYLVRHAESCSNLLDSNITDTYDDKTKWSEYHTNIKNSEIDNYTNKKLTFVQEKIHEKELLLDEYMRQDGKSYTLPSGIKPDDIKGIERKIELTDDKQLKAYYVKNLMPKYTWLFEPPLSIFGMLQSFRLQQYLASDSISPDVIYSSSVVRTIMTAFLALCAIDTPNNNILFICPYINETQNWAGETIDCDNQNKANSSSEIRHKIGIFVKWFEVHGVDVYKLFLQITKLPHPVHTPDITFPQLNYSLLESYEKTDPDGFRISDKKKFKDLLLTHLSSSSSSSSPPKILVFTHGKFIKEITSISVIPKNTSITKCSLNISDEPVSVSDVNSSIYEPQSIRSLFESGSLPDSLYSSLNTCNSNPPNLMGLINSTVASGGGKSKNKRKNTKNNRRSRNTRRSKNRRINKTSKYKHRNNFI